MEPETELDQKRAVATTGADRKRAVAAHPWAWRSHHGELSPDSCHWVRSSSSAWYHEEPSTCAIPVPQCYSRPMKRKWLVSSCTLLGLGLVAGACEKAPAKNDKAASKTASAGASRPQPAPVLPAKATPPLATDLDKYTEGLKGEGTLMARITTNMGEINCELFEKRAPLTVANFVGLARGLHPFVDVKTKQVVKRPFYDGLIFHRVIPRFMIQGGDPLGQGNGGPGYRFANEISADLKHDKGGIMSMANAGPNTNGSQFFITEQNQKRLDGDYNVFGECMEVDVVGKIARVAHSRTRPNDNVVMETVEILRGDIKQFPKKPFVPEKK